MYIFGCLDWQRLSGIILILSVLVVLMLTSTTAQLLGGSFVVCFMCMAALVLGKSSFVSTMTLKFVCNFLVLWGV